MIAIDILISARWIIPIQPRELVLEDHSLAIQAGRIVAVVPQAQALIEYAPKQHVQLVNHAIIPGLVNLHTHAAMSLLRGLADDLALMTWLKDHIWPAEAKYVSPDFVKDGSLLACAEMLRGGITCFSDMYFFPEATAAAVDQSGMRAMLGMIALEFPSAYAADADDYLRKGLETRDLYRSHERLRFCMAPHAPYTVSDKTLTQVLTLAEQLDIPIHIHVHETLDEIAESVQQFQQRPLARLEALGILGPQVVAAHMVHLNAAEIALCAERGVHIAHCPISNLKLASGIAPISAFLSAGVNVGLGTDGAASNNRLDLLSDMRLSALLAKGSSGDATAVPAHQALAMATLHGARALGLEDEIGTLEAGKAADMVAFDCSSLEMSPCFDLASHLVYVAGREHISDVWVGGKRLLEQGALTALDPQDIAARTARWQTLLSR